MKRFASIRKDKRKSTEMAAPPQQAAVPPRQETMSSIASDEAVPDTDPNTVRFCQLAGMPLGESPV
jgi:hypothetical protein